MKPTPDQVSRTLAALEKNALCCPFCDAPREHVFPSEEGPQLELFEGEVAEDDDAASHLTHLVYCGKEDRNFLVVYRPRDPLPECPSCESDFDVAPYPPERHFDVTSTFEAVATCTTCDEEIGPITCVAFDIRDGGHLGN